MDTQRSPAHAGLVGGGDSLPVEEDFPMRVVVAGAVFALLLACHAARSDDKSDKDSPTPRAQYDALVKEHGKAQQAYFAALQKADNADRSKVMKEEGPKLEKVLVKLLELADKNPKDPVAVDALLMVASDTIAARSGGTSRDKALQGLARDHAASEKVAALCQRLGFTLGSPVEKLLRAVLEKNPAKSARAEACLALAQNLRRQAAIARRLAEDKELAGRAEEFFGKETVAELAKLDPAKVEKEGEKLSEQFAEKYVSELKAERLASLCQQLGFSADKGSEAILRKLTKHDTKEVKGVAILGLAQVLKQQADEESEKNPKSAAALMKESEKLFEEAAEKYADVKAGFRGTVGQTAKKDLYEIRHLAIGKTAPEVEGVDQDGKKFKLSDYKGKVVLLDFWSQF
jgi:hypothetical protein